MAIIELEVELKASDNSWMKAILYILDDLIILSSTCISSQWPLDHTGVELTNYGDGDLKIGFWHTGCATNTYQSFIFNADKFLEIEKFFKDQRFPVPRKIILDTSPKTETTGKLKGWLEIQSPFSLSSCTKALIT